ncbi:MAG TPA: glycine cleavage system aminomethyltransferase GcvT [Polyangia bacterium]
MTPDAGSPKNPPRKTPLYESHRKLGAKLIDFGGWMMPVSYPAGIVEEHRATRNAVGVFDVSHMGEVHFRGPRAREAVQRLITNDVGQLSDGAALYTCACHDNGGVVDDLIVYRIAADHLLLVVNASNIDKDFQWFSDNVGTFCDLENASDATGLIAFQGPGAARALAGLTTAPLATLKRMHFLPDAVVAGKHVTIARTGYTGEDGFELFCSNVDAPALWDALVDAAATRGGKPVGLGARDTLRLEARLPLYGNDLDDTTTPLEAGLGWTVKLDAATFIGHEALRKQKAEGVKRRLAGFVMRERGIARHGYPIAPAPDAPGAPPAPAVGVVTSGSYCPTVDKNVGLGYVPTALAEPGQRLAIDCRGRFVAAEVVKGPFYQRSNA